MYKAALGIAYGAGMRGVEVVVPRVSDIDSKRMLIRVEMGKGHIRQPWVGSHIENCCLAATARDLR